MIACLTIVFSVAGNIALMSSYSLMAAPFKAAHRWYSAVPSMTFITSTTEPSPLAECPQVIDYNIRRFPSCWFISANIVSVPWTKALSQVGVFLFCRGNSTLSGCVNRGESQCHLSGMSLLNTGVLVSSWAYQI